VPVLDCVRAYEYLMVLEGAMSERYRLDFVAIEGEDLTIQSILKNLDREWLPDDDLVLVVRVIN